MRLDQMSLEDAFATRDELRTEVNHLLLRKGVLITTEELEGEAIEFVMEFILLDEGVAKALAGAVAGFCKSGDVIHWRKAPALSIRNSWTRVYCCFVVSPVIAVAAA